MVLAAKLNLQLFEGESWNVSFHDLEEEASKIPVENWESWLGQRIKKDIKK